jgi:uncharacterized protein (DUF1810 family)
VTASDRYNLNRFVQAQAPVYKDVLSELRSGKKCSHWMWFIFPQLEGLGRSSMAQHYSIKGANEALAYLNHPLLGPRLRECVTAVNDVVGRSAHEIFGSPDDMKLHSSATLFAQVSQETIFQQLLEKYFDSRPDDQTVRLLSTGSEPG